MKNITSLYCSYKDLVSTIGDTDISESYKTCYESFLDFSEKLGLQERITIDERVLMHSICDAYADIMRLKDFHHIIKENPVKTLAYRCSWLLRRKPIKVLGNETEEDLVYINEKFVYSLIASCLMQQDVDLSAGTNDSLCVTNYLNALLYYLKYRSCTPQVLEIIILSFQAGGYYNNLLVQEK